MPTLDANSVIEEENDRYNDTDYCEVIPEHCRAVVILRTVHNVISILHNGVISLGEQVDDGIYDNQQ